MTTGDCICPSNVTIDTDGYPVLKFNKRKWRMNRWMWTMVNGPIPDNQVVAHRCNNKACINTNHFYLATAEQNSTDAARDGLYKVGQEHGRAVVSDNQVIEIAKLYNDGMRQQQIGKLFGISQGQVSYVIRKRLPYIANR